MKIKSLMTASVVALVSVSASQAADVMVPREVVSDVVIAPEFSWTGFYLGGQVGGFKTDNTLKTKSVAGSEWEKTAKELFPKMSSAMFGLYAGYNVGLGQNFVVGVDTDVVFANAKSKDKTVNSSTPSQDADVSERAANGNNSGQVWKTKWSGATRARVGYAFDRVMPYVAGGVAYAQVKSPFEDSANSVAKKSSDNKKVSKTMVGFTIGGGVDYAMTDSVILRAEYRYSDFGKKEFVKDSTQLTYKTNDFRVGVAYKF
ncbi:outer membrane protein [Bartonella sp. F02]|uniref:outer membrane protein n=1 Tax=Bartonella sp. F02 TaxID=2967262 RepID=UPI0022A97A02|nr:outer membrane protein [Bartonella sp. F02]MCZ2328089.1 porin family protein [Bartonella sp. F02]